MATLANAIVKLIADTAGFDDAMKKSIGDAAKMGKGWQQTGEQMTNVGKNMTMGVTAPLAAAGFAATQMASDLNETKNKVNVVFGGMAEGVMDWSANSVQAMGLTQNEALSAAGTYGNLMVSMGMGTDQAAQMSTSMVQLATDLGSFHNMDTVEVLDKLRAGLTGESEPLKQFGVVMDQAALKAKAMEMGLLQVDTSNAKYKKSLEEMNGAQQTWMDATSKYGENSTEAKKALGELESATDAWGKAAEGATEPMTAQIKTQAAYGLIMEQTAIAQGDFNNTSGGLANQQKILQKSVLQTATTMGTILLPIGLQIVTFLNDLATKFAALTPEQQKTILMFAGVAAAIGPILMVVGTIVSTIGTLMPVFAAIGGVIAGITLPIWGIAAAVIAVVALIAVAWANNWGGIQEKTAAVWEWLKGAFAVGLQFVQDLFGGKLGWFSEIWKNTWDSITTIFSTWWENIKLMFALIGAVFEGDWRKVGEIARQIWDNTWTMLKTVFQNGIDNIVLFVKGFPKTIMDFMKSVDWKQVGINVIQGIANGLIAGPKILFEAVTSVGNALMQMFAGFFDMHSPSRKMKVQVGYQLAAGIADGLTMGAGKLLPGSVGAVNSGLSGFGGGKNGRGGVVVNINVTGGGNDYETAKKIAQSVREVLRRESVVSYA
jgi:hypothetical protein